jgi:hypothetical protein
MMKTIAMATEFRALSRSCFPAFGPTHSTRLLGDDARSQLGAEPVHELVPLRLELDLDAVVARVRDLRVRRALAEVHPGDAAELRLDLVQVRIGLVAGRDLVAAGAELHLGRARVRWTGDRVGDRSLRVLGEAERGAELRLRRLVDDADVLNADEEVVGIRGVLHLDDVGGAEPARLDRLADLGGVDVLRERDLDLGPAAEVGAVVRPRIERERRRCDHEEDGERDPEPPHRHEIELPARLE